MDIAMMARLILFGSRLLVFVPEFVGSSAE
jgi:hypothetical protein